MIIKNVRCLLDLNRKIRDLVNIKNIYVPSLDKK